MEVADGTGEDERLGMEFMIVEKMEEVPLEVEGGDEGDVEVMIQKMVITRGVTRARKRVLVEKVEDDIVVDV